ncbi:hypothetical protein KIN20_019768 [Parelaphostrongylus tenuis]|uniref:Uncharacterized protein n=1 Tax=Parelaphostrongylus tenuis TaxID=148309 RepID=A0AAD5N3G1_PARTN|nr:hypothetical protein KIN20_019768 [Parelaphostrongylus tenuis]
MEVYYEVSILSRTNMLDDDDKIATTTTHEVSAISVRTVNLRKTMHQHKRQGEMSINESQSSGRQYTVSSLEIEPECVDRNCLTPERRWAYASNGTNIAITVTV